MKSKVHMMLHGKGGIGKSFLCCMLAQYLMSNGDAPLCVDIDPAARTFQSYEGLHVTRLDVLEGRKVSRSRFDLLFDMIGASSEGKDVVIDVGTSTFLAFWDYIISSDVAGLLDGIGREMVVHTVVTGGPGQEDSVKGAVNVVCGVPESSGVVVWLNPYWGPVARDGTDFEMFHEYEAVSHRIESLIRLPEYPPLFRQDLADMLRMRLTFDEALTSGQFWLLNLQRLVTIRREIFQLMDVAPALGATTLKKKTREITMAMADDPRLQKMIHELESKYHVSIKPGDPILIALAANDWILQRHEEGIKGVIDHFWSHYNSKIEGIDQKVVRACESVGTAVLEAAMEHSKEEALGVIDVASDKAEKMFGRHAGEWERIYRDVRFERWICGVAVVFCIACALLVFWMTR